MEATKFTREDVKELICQKDKEFDLLVKNCHESESEKVEAIIHLKTAVVDFILASMDIEKANQQAAIEEVANVVLSRYSVTMLMVLQI